MKGSTGGPMSAVGDPAIDKAREKADAKPAITKRGMVIRDSKPWNRGRYTPEYQAWLDRQKAKRS